MIPIDDPFEWGGPGDSGAGEGGAVPPEPLTVRPVCRSPSTAARARIRRRGGGGIR